jgi:thiamine pyrophosphokinase
MSRTVIFANGELADPGMVRSLLLPGDRILCANGGTRHVLALGFTPDLIIGDLDSLNADDRRQIEASAVSMHPHPHDKNETDLELALLQALTEKPRSVLIVGGLGRRLDHTLGNIALLSDPALSGMDVRLDDGLEEVFFCRERAAVNGSQGDIVSLLPWSGPVKGIRTEGLKWPLRGETLLAERTRGISNEMLGNSAHVTVASGLLLIIHRRQTQAENRAS